MFAGAGGRVQCCGEQCGQLARSPTRRCWRTSTARSPGRCQLPCRRWPIQAMTRPRPTAKHPFRLQTKGRTNHDSSIDSQPTDCPRRIRTVRHDRAGAADASAAGPRSAGGNRSGGCLQLRPHPSNGRRRQAPEWAKEWARNGPGNAAWDGPRDAARDASRHAGQTSAAT